MNHPNIRVLEMDEAPPQARRRAEELLDVEGLHSVIGGVWLFCGPLQRTAGHQLSIRPDEMGEREGKLRVVIEHRPPAGFAAQVLTRPHLLFALEEDADLEVMLREPDGHERLYLPSSPVSGS